MSPRSSPRLPIRTATTDDSGVFLFRNVPQNSYHLAVTAHGFEVTQQDVDVRTSVPIELTIAMKIASSNEAVEVRAEAGDLLENDPSAHTDVDSVMTAKIPLESTQSALSQIITYSSPGVVADSNGFFHPLGDDMAEQNGIVRANNVFVGGRRLP